MNAIKEKRPTYFQSQIFERLQNNKRILGPTFARALNIRGLVTEGQVVKKAKAVEPEMLCGIYFLVQADSVVYIGQATNVYSRVLTHVREGRKKFDSWCYVPCKREELDLMESVYIHYLDPPQNGKVTGKDIRQAPISQLELAKMIIPGIEAKKTGRGE